MMGFPEFQIGRNIWPQDVRTHPLSDKLLSRSASSRAGEFRLRWRREELDNEAAVSFS
jgi:hypothetical protein